MKEFTSKVIFLSNKKTSLRLAIEEWEALEYITKQENIKRNMLFDLINNKKSPFLGLTSAIRLFAIVYFHNMIINKKNKYYSPIFDAIKRIM